MPPLKSVTSQEMKRIDRTAIETYGIPSLLLMENAGRGISELISNLTRGRRVTVFAGKGNNGGDGLAAARHLYNRGFQIYVVLLADPDQLKGDPKINYEILKKMKVAVEPVTEDKPDFFKSVLERSDVTVDALFGVGLHSPVMGIYLSAIRAINLAGKNVVAVDVPSGLDSDTGEVLGEAVKAHVTATLALPKTGLFKGKGPHYSGRVCVVDIGIPRELLPS